jgi:cytochrome c-type biogenesis protein CcmH/NrfG
MHEMMGREVARQGNDKQAITDLQDALKINPHLPDAHRELGELYSHSTDEKLQAQAEPEFHAALADNPNDEKAHLLLGEAAAKAGDTQTAFAEDSLAVKLQPDDVDALVSLGKVLMTMNQHDKAEETFEHALKADPTNTVAHYRLSMIYRREGRIAEATAQMAEYRKYKDMQTKLEKIFHDLRVGPLQGGNSDDQDADGPDASH